MYVDIIYDANILRLAYLWLWVSAWGEVEGTNSTR